MSPAVSHATSEARRIVSPLPRATCASNTDMGSGAPVEKRTLRLESLLELLSDEQFKGRADLPQLAEESELTDEDLLPLADALHRLGLAQLSGGDLIVTPLGHNYVQGSHEFRRQLFGQQLLERVPLAAFIRHSLEQEGDGELKEEPFLKLLSDSMEAAEAERVLRVAIEWARYGEVFEYDYHTGLIHLPESDAG